MKTEEEYETLIKEHQQTIQDLDREVSHAKKQLADTLIERYIMRNGLNIGDVVKWDEWGKENGKHQTLHKKGRIVNFNVGYGKVNPVVRVCKKDGTLGERMRDYWNGSTQPVKI